jgi:hypothetical protein
MELGNVLSYWAYDPKAAERERHRLMWARRRARSLLVWVFDHYKLLDNDGKEVHPMEDFYWRYLAQLAKTIVFYRQRCHKAKINSLSELCTVKKVKQLVGYCVRSPPTLNKLYTNVNIPNTTLVWKGCKFTVEKVINPIRRKFTSYITNLDH